VSEALFRIANERFELSWSTTSPPAASSPWDPPGLLRVTGDGLKIDRCMSPDRKDPSGPSVAEYEGPRLHEETTYAVYVRSVAGQRLRLLHEDPVVVNQLSTAPDGAVFGTVNFGSAAGHSRFAVEVEGKTEATFEVEVFPTKLDYASDYHAMVADVQDLATSLALEYLRSTFQFASSTRDPRPVGDLEWVLLLRELIGDLERALRHVARSPRRAIVRPLDLHASNRVRRPDAAVRASVRKRSGRGPLDQVTDELAVRRHVWSRKATPTLDTAEHRWIATQLRTVRSSLARLVASLGRGDLDAESRHAKQRVELRRLERRVARLEQLEPLLEAAGDPPPNFASQQLQTAPGYREAYQTLLVLRSGLRLDGAAVRTSTKELHKLYEYWCYLTVVRLLADRLGHPPQLDELFRVRATGLKIELTAGRDTEVRFNTPSQRIRVRYNPRFNASDVILVPQRPDILVTLESEHWPTVHLLLDAKYRRDDTAAYRSRYGAPGPPEDALNVLHRYRDAILEVDVNSSDAQRTIVEAAALFPHQADDQFGRTRHWQSLQHIGVGAVPALPSNRSYLEQWIGGMLADSGWTLTDRTIQHAARSRYQELLDAERRTVRLLTVAAAEAAEFASTDRFLDLLTASMDASTAYLGAIVRPRASASFTRFIVRPVLGNEILGAEHSHRLGEAEERPLELDLQLSALPTTTTRLAVLRCERLSDLWLRRVAEWRLHDELSGSGSRPATVLGSNPPGAVWLSVAADARARYDAGERWVVERGPRTHRVGVDEAYRLLIEPLAPKLALSDDGLRGSGEYDADTSSVR